MTNVSDLIGIPFVSSGRDPKTGLDCWGLVLEVGRRFGKNWPDFLIPAEASKQIGIIYNFVQSEWLHVVRPEPGAIVGLRLDRACMPDVTQHFGVCLDKMCFIHTMQDVGVVITRLDHRFFKNIITGYYL